MSRRISIQSDYQMKQPLLCSACERRFSQNGENYVVPLLNSGRSFPLLDRLKLALPAIHDCNQHGIRVSRGRIVGREDRVFRAEHPVARGGAAMAEWSRNSCYPPVIVLEKTAKALATLDRWSAGIRHLVGARE